MRKIMNYLLMGAMVCGISLAATSCSKSDDDDVLTPPVQPEEVDDGANSSSFDVGYVECSWDGTQVVKTNQVANATNLATCSLPGSGSYLYLDDGQKYYVSGSLSISGVLRVNGGKKVDLILCDGSRLTVKEIRVEGVGSRLRIFGQERGTGTLTINAPSNGCAAIGCASEEYCDIEIHGGVIKVKGGYGAAAIGGGYKTTFSDEYIGTAFSTISIFGGTIDATGGDCSAAIGGSALSKNGGHIYIYGGDITAQGGDDSYGSVSFNGGAGIGGGHFTSFESLNIYGGNIKATGGEDAAGIGGGESFTNGAGVVNIHGGHIIAQGADYAAGIGGGDGRRLKSITITDGEVYAYAGVDGAGIGGGEDGDSGDINIYGGVVRAYGDRNASGSHKGFGAGIGSGQDGSVNTIRIYGGDIEAYGGEDAAGIGTGEEYTSSILSGTIEIYGGKIYAYGKGYGAGIGCGEDATFGVLGISGGRVDAHAGSDCGPWSGGIGAYHSEHEDGCYIGWAGWNRIYIGKGMRLWTYSPNVGSVENVTINVSWWDFVHQRPQVAFGECNHVDGAYDITNCPYCHSYTLKLE